MQASSKPSRGPNIVVIGGGTGSFTLLSGLKHYARNLTALVSMADDGGSTGQLRDELGVLPPGDVRQCLVALSDSPKVRDLFNYRFEEGTLKGHAFGNLFLTALEKMTGNFAEAIETAAEVLRVEGRVVPVTLDNVRFLMNWQNGGETLKGEGVIDEAHFQRDPRTAQLTLTPHPKVNPAAIDAIKTADIIVIAPGDLYTSLGQLLIVDGIGATLAESKAKVVYVSNLVTKKGHTDGFSVADHAAELERFAGTPMLDFVLYNTIQPSEELLKKYAKKGEYGVSVDKKVLKNAHYKSIGTRLISKEAAGTDRADALSALRTFIRHDSDKVAREIMKLYFA